MCKSDTNKTAKNIFVSSRAVDIYIFIHHIMVAQQKKYIIKIEQLN